MKQGVCEAKQKVQENIDKLDEKYTLQMTPPKKAFHVIDAIEAKYGLLGDRREERLNLQKSELLTDMHILEDYIRQVLEAVRNISTEVLGNE